MRSIPDICAIHASSALAQIHAISAQRYFLARSTLWGARSGPCPRFLNAPFSYLSKRFSRPSICPCLVLFRIALSKKIIDADRSKRWLIYRGGKLNRRRRKEKRTLSGTSRRFGPRKWAKSTKAIRKKNEKRAVTDYENRNRKKI